MSALCLCAASCRCSAAASAALKAKWAVVCADLDNQLADSAVNILSITYGVADPLKFLAQSNLCVGRNAVEEATLVMTQLESYAGSQLFNSFQRTSSAWLLSFLELTPRSQARKLFAQFPSLKDSLSGERII